MKNNDPVVSVEQIEPMIVLIRGQRVILGSDLATLYDTTTKALNQAVKRNADRFPADFMFQLTASEKEEVVTNCDHLKRLKFSPTLPYAFTEHGAIMAANVLNSPRAVQMSVFVVRAFVKMRALLMNQVDLARKLRELEKKLTEGLDVHEHAITDIIQQIMLLLNPPEEPEPARKPVGFLAKEAHAVYRARGGKRR